ncbi:MAG: type II secretion system F family protein [Roseovarius sp.]|nr:type II secretion system F family protein [Roseovarius sp.]
MDNLPTIDPIYFLYIGGFLGVLITFEGIRQALMGNTSDGNTRSRRMSDLRRAMAAEHLTALVRTAPKTTLLSAIPVYGTLPAKMRQAGMTMTPAVFLALCFACAFGLFCLAIMIVGVTNGIIIAVLSGTVIPMSVINIIRKKRVEKFSQLLPDALDLMMRGLRVGHPLNVTISNVANSMPDPIGTEFAIMADQITYGDDLVDAFFDLAERIDQEDMHYLAVSISIQHGTGGNLAAMLGTLARVIRGRFAMRRRITAISSEGRITAWMLSALPFMMYGATKITAPDYYSSVSGDPLFMPIAIAIVVLATANLVILRNLVNFRI